MNYDENIRQLPYGTVISFKRTGNIAIYVDKDTLLYVKHLNKPSITKHIVKAKLSSFVILGAVEEVLHEQAQRTAV